MVAIPPYAPSLRWYEEWFRQVSKGKSDDEAITIANRECMIAGKDFARTVIRNGDNPMILSVAVEGGSAKLKRRGSERSVKISGHGNWPHLHSGALEAVYGRMPYYRHIIPGIISILENTPGSLAELNRNLHSYLSSFLQPGSEIVLTEAVKERGKELSLSVDRSVSIIDFLMRFGPETNLILIPIKAD